METAPRPLIERLIGSLIPAASREHVLGDLRERYVSDIRYLTDAADVVPLVLWGHVRRSMTKLGGSMRSNVYSALGRAMFVALAAIAALTVLLEIPPLLSASSSAEAWLSLYAVPQALILAIPLGITVGILFGVTPKPASMTLIIGILCCAVVASMVSFVILTRIVPEFNLAFRASVLGSTQFAKSKNEMTRKEMREQVNSYARTGRRIDSRNLDVYYHSRLALSFAAVPLSLFALWFVTRRQVRGMFKGLVALLAFVMYLGALAGTEQAARRGVLSPVAIAWLPVVLFVLIGIAVLNRSKPEVSASFQ